MIVSESLVGSCGMFCWWVWRPLTGSILELGKSYRCYLRLPGVLGGDPITGVV